MSKTIFIALVAFNLFANGGKNKPDAVFVQVKVVEAVTNSPVSGASLTLFRCNYGCPFGPNILFTGVTDNNGICRVSSKIYNDSTVEMNVTKAKYWPFEVQKNTIVSITPEGWMQLLIHKVNSYPAGSKLKLNLKNQPGSRSDLTEYNAANDSLILVKAFGGQENKIDWQVVDPNFNLIHYGTLSGLQIPRLDMLKNSTLNY